MSGDAFSPDAGQVINPDGTATYDFQGHIGAIGLDIISTDTAQSGADRKIRWHKDSLTGAVVAEMMAFHNEPPSGPTNSLLLDALAPDGHGNAFVDVLAADSGGTYPSSVSVSVQSGLRTAAATLIDSDKGSTFTRSLSGVSTNEDFSLLAQTDITAFAGPTGSGGFGYTFALPFAFPTVITGCWLDGLNPQDANLQLRVQPNGSANSIDAWFFNGTGANQNLLANLYLTGS